MSMQQKNLKIKKPVFVLFFTLCLSKYLQTVDNLRRGRLHSHARAGAKIGLAVSHTESNHQNSLFRTGSFFKAGGKELFSPLL
jgi:hypothetical protein